MSVAWQLATAKVPRAIFPVDRVHAWWVRTSQLAGRAHVDPQTLWYSERRGLLAEPERSVAGSRVYLPDAVQRVRFIKRSQELRFALAEVETLLHLARGGADRDCPILLALDTLADRSEGAVRPTEVRHAD